MGLLDGLRKAVETFGRARINRERRGALASGFPDNLEHGAYHDASMKPQRNAVVNGSDLGRSLSMTPRTIHFFCPASLLFAEFQHLELGLRRILVAPGSRKGRASTNCRGGAP